MYCYAQDQSFAGGSLGEAHADTIVRVMQLAGRAGAPVIGFVASGGARMDDGIAALGGYGRIFRESVRLSGQVPQISVITGVSAGGGAYSPALTDFVVMTEGSAMFLTGPGVVREVMGEDVDAPAARRPAGALEATASASSWPPTTATRSGSSATCSPTCRSAPASAAARAAGAGAVAIDPAAVRARARRARSTTCAR